MAVNVDHRVKPPTSNFRKMSGSAEEEAAKINNYDEKRKRDNEKSDQATPCKTPFSVAQLQRLLRKKKLSRALSFLKEERNESLIKNESLELVSAICSFCKENVNYLKEKTGFDTCSKMLDLLVEKGNSKEVLLGLLEASDSFVDVEVFQILLLPIQNLLIRDPGKRGKSMEWVLDALGAHLISLPLPRDPQIEDNEEEGLLLLDLDPDVQNLAISLDSYLKFLKPFIIEISFDNVKKMKSVPNADQISPQRNMFRKYLLMILGKPLLYHDLYWQKNRAASSIQSSCLKILNFLSQISTDFFDLNYIYSQRYHEHKDYEKEVNIKPTVATYANLSYLIFCENLCSNSRPYVYSGVFLFEAQVHLIIFMLKQNKHLLLFKGLHLCEALLNQLMDFALADSLLSCDKYRELSKSLLVSATVSKVQNLRTLSIKCFKSLMEKFSWEVRYGHLLSMFMAVHHQGVQGYIIGLYKDFLHLSFNNVNTRPYFCNKNLHVFLHHTFQLNMGAETDLLENFDKIISSLNFFRFLIVFDSKSNNRTGVWDIMDLIRSSYFKPLQRGIELSKAHYELREKENKEKIALNKEGNSDFMKYEISIIQRAFVSLDMIESILSRVIELIG